MLLNYNKTARNISANISGKEIKAAIDHIENKVNDHCVNNPNDPFSVRILFGGDNRDWGGTPLQCIYEYYLNIRKTKRPANDAAKDVGRLLIMVLENDRRDFELIGKDTGNKYRVI